MNCHNSGYCVFLALLLCRWHSSANSLTDFPLPVGSLYSTRVFRCVLIRRTATNGMFFFGSSLQLDFHVLYLPSYMSHWDPYAVHRGGCLELYYCNMVEWSWWDSSLICKTNWFPSVFWHCWFVIWPVNIVPEMTYNVLSGTLILYTTTTVLLQSNTRAHDWYPIQYQQFWVIFCASSRAAVSSNLRPNFSIEYIIKCIASANLVRTTAWAQCSVYVVCTDVSGVSDLR